jgi:hypothetical protein
MILVDADSGLTNDNVLISMDFFNKTTGHHNKNTSLEASTSRVKVDPHKILNFLRIYNAKLKWLYGVCIFLNIKLLGSQLAVCCSKVY